MTKNYTIKRDEIYAGKVIGRFNVNKSHNNIITYRHYRSILFTINKDGLAEDLLYNSPNYPIFTFKDVNNFKLSKIVIKDATKLDRLLQYYGYNDELYYNQILNIRHKFFDENFLRDNCELFGYMEIEPEQEIFYDKFGNVISNPDIIANLIKRRTYQQSIGIRKYTPMPDIDSNIEKHLIPEEYFWQLSELRDHSLLEVLAGYENKTNAFKPHIEEGPIRSLKKHNF